jgi:ankyrin repeat protein
VKLLLEKGAELESKDTSGRTPLSLAAGRGHEAVVQLLLKQGAEPEFKDSMDRTPFWWAARGGNGTAKLLLATDRVNVDSRDRYNSTPLSIAARMGHREVVVVLLTRSCGLNVKDNFGRTPLWWAKRTGYPEIADLLLEKYKETNIIIQEDDLPSTMISVPSDNYSGYCDVCVLSILDKETYYHCGVCYNGHFVICKECFTIKAHCLNESHIFITEIVQ